MSFSQGGDHGALDCDHFVRNGIVVGRQFIPLWLTNQNRVAHVEQMWSGLTFEISVGLGPFHGRRVEFFNRRIGG